MTTVKLVPSSHLFPQVDELSAPFYAAAARGQLLVQRCMECDRLRWTPRPMCPWCLSTCAGWSEVKPTGFVWSFCIVHPPVLPELADRTPFPVALIELEERPTIRMLGDVVDASEERLRIGAPVHAVFEQIMTDIGLIHWRLSD
jgi:uncharacterized protein